MTKKISKTYPLSHRNFFYGSYVKRRRNNGENFESFIKIFGNYQTAHDYQKEMIDDFVKY